MNSTGFSLQGTTHISTHKAPLKLLHQQHGNITPNLADVQQKDEPFSTGARITQLFKPANLAQLLGNVFHCLLRV